MARSIRVPRVGFKQTYNLNDTGDLTRALKAINERISEIERTWGQDSQIYRDYTAPLRTIEIQKNVRVDKMGRLKFKTGKGQNVEEVKTAVVKMLSKKTKGDIIEQTRQQLKVGKTVYDKNFMTYEQVKKISEEYKTMYDELNSLLKELYNLVGQNVDTVCRELGIDNILDGNWSTLTYEQLNNAIDELQKYIKENSETNVFEGKTL